jgi:tetratricopeptide (TPR) repeat protein
MEMKDLLNHYIKVVQELCQSPDEEKSSSRICHLIDSYSEKCGQNLQFQYLFLGEKAFWQSDYEKAIKNYLQAKNVPYFQFFCFRATAYLSEKHGERDKAVAYAEKALAMIPNDRATSFILDKLASDTSPAAADPSEAKELSEIFKDHSRSSLFLDEKPFSEVPKDSPVSPYPSQIARIEAKLKEFKDAQTKVVEHYQKLLDDRTVPNECFLTLLNCWDRPMPADSALAGIIRSDRLKNIPTGMYIRWKNKGIAINPGRRFLDHFHQSGYLVQDIDYIIITQCDPESYHDLMPIYLLNERLNELGNSRHIIHYYINGKVHQEISPFLHPHYKDERHMVHPLEIFVDSSDVETLPLDDGIILKYFSTCPSANDMYKRSTLGITLEFDRSCATLKVGYISGCPWSPLISHHLEDCRILCAGIGYTTEDDIHRKKYLSDCLGYNGLLSLLQNLSPEILVCQEFSGHKGDLRLDLIKQLRSMRQGEKPSALFAGDLGFYLDLEHMQIRCNATSRLVSPEEIATVNMQGSHSRLQYLSRDCVI